MTGRRWRWYAAGLMLSLLSMLAGILTNGVIASLAFLPVLVLFLGLPLVAVIERSRAVPSWYVLPLSFLLGLIVTALVLLLDLAVTSGSEHVMAAASSIAAALNGLQLVMEPRDASTTSRRRPDRKTAAAASVFVVLLVLVAYTMVQPFPSKPLTEFYILTEDGKTTDLPYQVPLGENVSLIVGIANHERRTVQYHMQVWLEGMDSASDPNSTNSMYFLETINVTLDHMPMPLSGQWVPQYEFDYNFTVSMDGSQRLWFFLFFDEAPPEIDNLTPMTDYYDEGTALIEKARDRQLLSLSIQLYGDVAEA